MLCVREWHVWLGCVFGYARLSFAFYDAHSLVAFALQCKTAEGRGSKTGLRWPDMGVECAVQGGCRGCGAAGRPSDAPRSGRWVQGARGGAGWVDQGGGGAACARR
jgi:hypothetical protein